MKVLTDRHGREIKVGARVRFMGGDPFGDDPRHQVRVKLLQGRGVVLDWNPWGRVNFYLASLIEVIPEAASPSEGSEGLA